MRAILALLVDLLAQWQLESQESGETHIRVKPDSETIALPHAW
jgi:hypothetical protein